MTLKNFLTVFFITAVLLYFEPACASTLVLEGGMDGSMDITQERVFSVPRGGLGKLTFRFANPAASESVSFRQTVKDHTIEYDPGPDSTSTEKDGFGNTYTTVIWKNIKKDARVREKFNAGLDIRLKDIGSSALFPLSQNDILQDGAVFLRPAPLVQSEDPEIKRLASILSKDSKTEQAAVMSVLNWVIDNIRYRSPVPAYDASWTLKQGYGNCQNFSHLSIAMLRAIGIPSRIVGGVALGKSWKVPLEKGALLQTIGQGGHAWIEVWYPDLGWVPYDAQQSHLFVGPRHIKQTVGLDSNDINDSWRASPVLPSFRENIHAEFLKDDIGLKLKETIATPVSYVMTSSLAPSLIEAPPQGQKAPPLPVPSAGPAEFGNMEFPSLIDFYVQIKGEGHKTFDKETAEYVTGDITYAQAFTVARPLRLDTVSLAMHKFGGRIGSLWIDVVKDDGGRPGMVGVRSRPVFLDKVKYSAGYKWFDFSFAPADADKPLLKEGRYWIILRHSKDTVVNWFYTPGNPYGLPDDARSTSKGVDWSNIMNYDFNFKVKGAFIE